MQLRAKHLHTLSTVLFLAITTSNLHAAITPTGNVLPTYNGTYDPWFINAELLVGQTANGSLLLDNASTINTQGLSLGVDGGVTGTLLISDSSTVLDSSDDIYVGVDGIGHLSVQNDAELDGRSDTVNIGYGSTGLGTVNLDNASLIVSELNIGVDGYGTFDMTNQSYLRSYDISIGKNAGGFGIFHVSGAGTKCWYNDIIVIGEHGTGVFVVDDEAGVDSDSVYIGMHAGSSGSVSIQNGASWRIDGFTGDALRVGYEGYGSLTIGNDARICVDTYTQLGYGQASAGVIQFNDGELRTNGLLTGIDELRGTGTIHTNSLVTDIDLVFDQTHGYEQTIFFNHHGNQNITIYLDASDTNSLDVTGAGYRGNGSLTIADGSYIQSGYAYLGYHAGSYGRATIDGEGSTWKVYSELFIGKYGNGDMIVTNGGFFEYAHHVHIGHGPNTRSSLTVEGDGSYFRGGFFHVGREGGGSILVRDGGHLSSSSVQLFGQPDNRASALVAGPGSLWEVYGTLYMGHLFSNSDAVITIRNGALLDVNGNIEMVTPGSTINLESGTLSLLEYDPPPAPRISLDEDTNETAKITGGTLNFTGGRLQGANVIDLDQPFHQQGGTLAPGQDIGQTLIIGDAILTAGILEIQLGGEENAHDSLISTGDMKIYFDGMTLDLKPVGYIPAGDYTIMKIQDEADGSIFGTFGGITGLGMIEDLVDITYTLDAVTLTFNRDYTFGDFDQNGYIGLSDLNVILDNWNQYNPALDLNGDNYIGLEDLDLILNNWHQGSGGPVSRITVPEPAMLLTLTFAATVLLRSRRVQ